jgi:hypothetical protein
MVEVPAREYLRNELDRIFEQYRMRLRHRAWYLAWQSRFEAALDEAGTTVEEIITRPLREHVELPPEGYWSIGECSFGNYTPMHQDISARFYSDKNMSASFEEYKAELEEREETKRAYLDACAALHRERREKRLRVRQRSVEENTQWLEEYWKTSHPPPAWFFEKQRAEEAQRQRREARRRETAKMNLEWRNPSIEEVLNSDPRVVPVEGLLDVSSSTGATPRSPSFSAPSISSTMRAVAGSSPTTIQPTASSPRMPQALM